MTGLAAFREPVNCYYNFQWQHISTEESKAIPLARKVLPPEDRAAIDAAFEANDSPWEGRPASSSSCSRASSPSRRHQSASVRAVAKPGYVHMMRVHGYFRSGAAWRLRIALNLKGIAVEQAYVHLRKRDQAAPAFRALNPQGLVPVLEHDGAVLTQSLAIIEYLEEIQPQPSLLPPKPVDRAFVRAIALAIACDIHPLDNLRVLNYLKDELHVDDAGRDRWYTHWVAEGFAALERMLAADPRVRRFCFGDTPTLADIGLVPQMGNAERTKCQLDAYPTLRRIRSAALELPAFAAAEPDRQPDAQ